MNWEKYLRKATDKEIENWEDALKQFIKEGKKLGMPLEVITKLEGAATTTNLGPAEINTTYGDDEDDDDIKE
jgi:hypothetical protein